MKQLSRTLTILLFTAAGAAAHAEQQAFYGGASIGGSDWNHSLAGVDGNSHGVTGKVYGGYNFTPNFALEAGAARLGSMSDPGGRIGANAVFVDGVGTWPLGGSKWSLLGRAGLARADFNGSVGNDSGTGLKLGAGVQYDLSPTTALRAEYEQYRIHSVYDSHASVGQVTVGLKAGF
jgi:OOP family OmpA-OmpF porin